MRLPLAPKYWIGKVKGLSPSSGQKRFEGFLNQIAGRLQNPGATVTDLRDVLTKVEQMLPQMNATQRRPFLALYHVFHGIVPPNHWLRNYRNVQMRYKAEIERPSIETLLVHLVLETDPEWTLTEHRRVHNAYFDNRDKKSGLKVPRVLEAGLSLELAEKYRAANDPEHASELIAVAVENHPGHARLYELEQNFNPKIPIAWHSVVFPTTKSTAENKETDNASPLPTTGASD